MQIIKKKILIINKISNLFLPLPEMCTSYFKDYSFRRLKTGEYEFGLTHYLTHHWDNGHYPRVIMNNSIPFSLKGVLV